MGTNSKAIIDASVLEKLRQLGGDALLSEMIALFISHAENTIKDALAGFAAGSFSQVRHSAHSLKSSAGNLGAYPIQRIAEDIEQYAENRNFEKIGPLLDQLQTAYTAVKSRLAEEKV
jgi:two-component system, sensor histidine kinase and response regulator